METKSGKLIVNYLPQTMTDSELYSMFITIGPIESCKIMKDNKTGYSYGYGFVTFFDENDAERAINSLNGLQISNKRIKVSYSRPPGEQIKETNLYITNLPKNYTDQDLENLFAPFGTIVQKNLLLDKYTKLPRGVAFVRFNKKEEANDAITALNGHIPNGSVEGLCVRVAEEHGKQKAAYYAGWQAALHQSRGGTRGNVRGGAIRGARGGRIGSNDNHFISYPIRNPENNIGYFRKDRMQHRFNPLAYSGDYDRFL